MLTTASVSCVASRRYELRLRKIRSKYCANQWLCVSEHDGRCKPLPKRVLAATNKHFVQVAHKFTLDFCLSVTAF